MLTDLDLINGFNLCLENSKNLIFEATLLKEHNASARAYALFQFSMEESGKCNILYKSLLNFFMNIQVNSDTLSAMGFSNHKVKTKESLVNKSLAINRFEKHIKRKTKLSTEVKNELKNINAINDLKNNSLYVNIYCEKFISPSEIITSELLNEIEINANISYKAVELLLVDISQIKENAIGLKSIINDEAQLRRFIIKHKVDLNFLS